MMTRISFPPVFFQAIDDDGVDRSAALLQLQSELLYGLEQHADIPIRACSLFGCRLYALSETWSRGRRPLSWRRRRTAATTAASTALTAGTAARGRQWVRAKHVLVHGIHGVRIDFQREQIIAFEARLIDNRLAHKHGQRVGEAGHRNRHEFPALAAVWLFEYPPRNPRPATNDSGIKTESWKTAVPL